MQARFKKGSKEAKAFMAKLRAKKGATKKVGTIKKSSGIRAKKQYNKEVDLYKYFVVNNGKVEAGFEYKSDANDMATDFYPKAKVLTKLQLKQQGIKNPQNDWKYKVGSTLKLSPKETRLGMAKHKDTKSHNVNIRVISGVEDTKAVRDLMEKDIFYTVETLNRIVDNLPNLTNKAEIARHKLQIRAFKKMVEDKKKQLRALNKLINSNLK